jgi:TRAP-type mannitol/chloroaromatic compound transport system permease small subunit
MKLVNNYIRIVDTINEKVGYYTSWLSTLLVLVVVYDVITRYVFNKSSVAVQEFEWHLFAVLFLMSSAYTLLKDEHVRVDLFYSKFDKKKQAWIDMVGTVFLLLPFVFVVLFSSLNYVESSFLLNESSPDPGGLPMRYLLKAFIPLSFFLLILQGFSLLLKSLKIIVDKEKNI